MAKLEIVQFSDGKYAIRKKSFWSGTEYLDLINSRYYWSISNRYFKDCISGDFEEIKKVYCRIKNKPKVINCDC